MQVDMRAPGRGHSSITIGTPDGGQGIVYPVSSTGVATVHSSHVAAAKGLGFTLCSAETADAPPVASYSAEDYRAMLEYKKYQAKGDADAKASEDAQAADKAKSEQATKSAQAAAANQAASKK
jgi:hypothetical protein